MSDIDTALQLRQVSKRYTGRILIGVQEVTLHSPAAAKRHGIQMIHQELTDVSYDNFCYYRERKLQRIGKESTQA